MAQRNTSEKASSQTLKAVLGIRELVFSGEVAPGERMSEVNLSARLGLSRTPIRAGLARLEQEGILELIPSGGYTVRSFTEADIVDAIELRGVLEGTAARLAAERGIPPSRLAAMKSILAEIDKVVSGPGEAFDFPRYTEMNAEFHDLLKALSGSEIIAREIDRVMRLPFAGPSAFLNAQPDIPEFRTSLVVGQAQHRAIAHAIEMREGARAEAVAREHSRLARQNLDFVMDDHKLMARVPGLMLVSG